MPSTFRPLLIAILAIFAQPLSALGQTSDTPLVFGFSEHRPLIVAHQDVIISHAEYRFLERALGQVADENFEIVMLPGRRMLNSLQKEQVDIAIVPAGAEQLSGIARSDVVVDVVQMAILQRSESTPINSINDVIGKDVLSAWPIEDNEFFQYLEENSNLLPVSSRDIAMNMLFFNRADYVLDFIVPTEKHSASYLGMDVWITPVFTLPMYFVYPENKPELASLVDELAKTYAGFVENIKDETGNSSLFTFDSEIYTIPTMREIETGVSIMMLANDEDRLAQIADRHNRDSHHGHNHLHSVENTQNHPEHSHDSGHHHKGEP